MPTPELLTAECPSALLEYVSREAARFGDRMCVVVSRVPLQRDVTTAVLRAGDRGAWSGPRVVSLEWLVAHYAVYLDPARTLTPLQVRQVIASVVLEIHSESAGTQFRGQVIGTRISNATLRSLTRFFRELEAYGLSPESLENSLIGEGGGSTPRSARAALLAETYRRYQARLRAGSFLGPQGRDILAAEAARVVPPPFSARIFTFLGFEGVGGMDIGMRLLTSLATRADVERVQLALTMPDELLMSAWPVHANDALENQWRDLGGGSRRIIDSGPTVQQRYGSRTDLACLATDPFAYRLPSVFATPAVRGVVVPDTSLELDWIAANVKRALTSDPTLAPNDIAIVERRTADRASDVVRALAERGIPAYASADTPLNAVPAVRAVLAPFLLLASPEWRVADLIAVAESPYLDYGINPTALANLLEDAPRPHGAAEWIALAERVAQLRADDGAADATVTATLATALRALADTLTALVGGAVAVAPSKWVAALRVAIAHWLPVPRIVGGASSIPAWRRAELARTDIDGLNALTRGASEWLLGRQVAGLTNDPITADSWWSELDAIVADTRIRATTYPRDGLHIVDPQDAALRSWRRVYIAGLAEGEFPRRAERDEHTVTDDERRALRLPTTDARDARERHFFHLAVAAATETLVLVAPASDARGRAMVPSIFLSAMPLRLTGFRTEQLSARELVPRDENDLHSPRDVHDLAAYRYRHAVSEAGLIEDRIAADPLLAAWLAQDATARVLASWQAERARMSGSPAPDAPSAPFAGRLRDADVPSAVRSADATFSPSDLHLYELCHFRYFATKMLDLRAGHDDADHDEAAAFGTVQHAVLEHLYRGLAADGRLPPRDAADIETALSRLGDVARRAVQTFTASAHAELLDLDLEFVLDVLRPFVRRDLWRMLAAGQDLLSPRLRTQFVGFERRVGGDATPFRVVRGGVEFRLRGTIDRIEAIDDPRAPRALGALLIHDYKTTRSPKPWNLKPERYLSGDNLQLPLYAAIAASELGHPVFGFGELHTAADGDPSLFAVRTVVPRDGGGIRFDRWSDRDNPVTAASDAAITRAATIVRGIRSGDFTPQADRECWGCVLRDVCRASKVPDPASHRARASMPVGVSIAEFEAASIAARAPRSAVEDDHS